jgi:hypothetical protein
MKVFRSYNWVRASCQSNWFNPHAGYLGTPPNTEPLICSSISCYFLSIFVSFPLISRQYPVISVISHQRPVNFPTFPVIFRPSPSFSVVPYHFSSFPVISRQYPVNFVILRHFPSFPDNVPSIPVRREMTGVDGKWQGSVLGGTFGSLWNKRNVSVIWYCFLRGRKSQKQD